MMHYLLHGVRTNAAQREQCTVHSIYYTTIMDTLVTEWYILNIDLLKWI
jgi:hypothetical protein